MTVINTNTKSLFAQNSLTVNNREMSKAMEQLSTGKRINTASDDAAGLAIASKMTSQIRGLDQAVRNAGDAISLLQTAEGAMVEITNMQQRMRELAVQSASDTNTSEDREYLDLEFQQLRQEIGRIAGNTQWNGTNILDGSFTANTEKGLFKFQVGANQNQTINMNMADMTAIPGLDAPPKGNISLSVNVDATGTASTDARVIDLTGTVPVEDQTFFVKFGAGDDAEMVSYIAADGDDLDAVLTGLSTAIGGLSQSKDGTDDRSVTVEVIGNSLVITEDTADGGIGDEDIAVTSFLKIASGTDAGPVAGTPRITLAENKLDVDLRGVEVAAGQAFQMVVGTQTYAYTAAVGDTSEEVAAGLAKAMDGKTDGFSAGLIATSSGSTIVVQMGTDDAEVVEMADTDNVAITTAMVFLTTGAVPATDSGANIKNAASSQAAIANLDSALKFVSEERATLGAVTNRLTAATDNLSNVSMNISASRSRVEDTDYAKTTTTLAKTQIIQQAATAMLAQANQQPSAVLSLLQ